jgi:hypothetical protein
MARVVSALEEYAGDVLQVGFYRGPQKMTTQMNLSARSIPEIPWTVAELTARLQKIYDDAQEKILQLLQGVSEVEAAFKPAADEWSVKEAQRWRMEHQRSPGTPDPFRAWLAKLHWRNDWLTITEL